jgi:hypothetical protein
MPDVEPVTSADFPFSIDKTPQAGASPEEAVEGKDRRLNCVTLPFAAQHQNEQGRLWPSPGRPSPRPGVASVD